MFHSWKVHSSSVSFVNLSKHISVSSPWLTEVNSPNIGASKHRLRENSTDRSTEIHTIIDVTRCCFLLLLLLLLITLPTPIATTASNKIQVLIFIGRTIVDAKSATFFRCVLLEKLISTCHEADRGERVRKKRHIFDAYGRKKKCLQTWMSVPMICQKWNRRSGLILADYFIRQILPSCQLVWTQSTAQLDRMLPYTHASINHQHWNERKKKQRPTGYKW